MKLFSETYRLFLKAINLKREIRNKLTRNWKRKRGNRIRINKIRLRVSHNHIQIVRTEVIQAPSISQILITDINKTKQSINHKHKKSKLCTNREIVWTSQRHLSLDLPIIKVKRLCLITKDKHSTDLRATILLVSRDNIKTIKHSWTLGQLSMIKIIGVGRHHTVLPRWLINPWVHRWQRLTHNIRRRRRITQESLRIARSVGAVLVTARAATVDTVKAKNQTKATHFKFNISRNWSRINKKKP